MEKEFARKLGRNIAKIRKEKGISQEELALRSGIDKSYISHIENGIKNITCYKLFQIAKALNVNITKFFEDIHDNRK